MINRIVQFALQQRMFVLLLVAFITVGGVISFIHMPVDAYPDLSPPMAQTRTMAPANQRLGCTHLA
jgi:cobalt-zinc-cadmium resistance protein CzcA